MKRYMAFGLMLCFAGSVFGMQRSAVELLRVRCASSTKEPISEFLLQQKLQALEEAQKAQLKRIHVIEERLKLRPEDWGERIYEIKPGLYVVERVRVRD